MSDSPCCTETTRELCNPIDYLLADGYCDFPQFHAAVFSQQMSWDSRSRLERVIGWYALKAWVRSMELAVNKKM